MNYPFLGLLVFCLFLLMPACTNSEGIESPIEKPKSTSINKVLPLGASRVAGARPVFESYRYNLWKRLHDGGYEFDYIGTVRDESSYPIYNGLSFDLDHEGRGGWTSGQIRAGIEGWLEETGAPDIVLFSSPGGNDGLQGLSYDEAIANINTIIDSFQAVNPNVTILIEQLAPAHSAFMTPALTAFMTQMQADVLLIAAEQTTPDSKVIAVDMATDFNDSLLADDVHYNEAGAKFIADRYYAVLENILE